MTAHHCTPGAGVRRSASIREWWRKRREQQPMPERWQRIIELKSRGMKQKAIAEHLGITPERVSQLLQKIAQRGAA